jgi:hypothetical protein
MEKGFRTVWDPNHVIQCGRTDLYIHGIESCIVL